MLLAYDSLSTLVLPIIGIIMLIAAALLLRQRMIAEETSYLVGVDYGSQDASFVVMEKKGDRPLSLVCVHHVVPGKDVPWDWERHGS